MAGEDDEEVDAAMLRAILSEEPLSEELFLGFGGAGKEPAAAAGGGNEGLLVTGPTALLCCWASPQSLMLLHSISQRGFARIGIGESRSEPPCFTGSPDFDFGAVGSQHDTSPRWRTTCSTRSSSKKMGWRRVFSGLRPSPPAIRRPGPFPRRLPLSLPILQTTGNPRLLPHAA